MTCSICIGAVQHGFLLECGHSFHNKCITRWLLKNETCPVCRKQIIEPGNVENHCDEDPIVIVLDMFDNYTVPEHIIQGIKYECDKEINLFIETTINDWSLVEHGEYFLEMVSQKKGRGKHKIKEECRFSITLSIIKNIYCFIVIIENYRVFYKQPKLNDNYLFRHKNNQRNNKKRQNHTF